MSLKKHLSALAVLFFVVTYGVFGVVATQLHLTHHGKPNHLGYCAGVRSENDQGPQDQLEVGEGDAVLSVDDHSVDPTLRNAAPGAGQRDHEHADDDTG